MTRLLVHDEPIRAKRGRLRWAEFGLLVIGLALLDVFIWFHANEAASQAYDSWSLDQQIAGHKPSVRGFISDQLHMPWLAPRQEAVQNPIVAVEKNERNPASRMQSHRHAPRPPHMALLGRVEVPRLGLHATVRQGTDDAVLAKAVGHMPSTALPGEDGNVAIAAHRDTLFRKLRDIQHDDRITFETPDGNLYDYTVESTQIVKPTDVSVLRASKDDRLLTLITCYPFNFVGHAPQRFIVKARQTAVTAQSRPPQQGTRTDF
jgi:sortase A